MNVQTNHTENSLNELTLTTITKINNHFANMVGTKETKRFGTKPAAVKKCLINQAEFNKQFPPKKTPVKTNISSSEFLESKLSLNVDFDSSKKGSLQDHIFRAIRTIGQDEETGEVLNTVSDVIFELKRTYKTRPRSEKNVDQAFAIRKIKRLIKKGKVTLTK